MMRSWTPGGANIYFDTVPPQKWKLSCLCHGSLAAMRSACIAGGGGQAEEDLVECGRGERGEEKGQRAAKGEVIFSEDRDNNKQIHIWLVFEIPVLEQHG